MKYNFALVYIQFLPPIKGSVLNTWWNHARLAGFILQLCGSALIKRVTLQNRLISWCPMNLFVFSVSWQSSCFHTGRPAVQSWSHSPHLDSTGNLCSAFSKRRSVTFSVWTLFIIHATTTTRIRNRLISYSFPFKSGLFCFNAYFVFFLLVYSNQQNTSASHLDVIFNEARRPDAGLHVETDVHLHVRFLVGQLDDWHLADEGETEGRTREMSRAPNTVTRSGARTGKQSPQVTSY